MPKTPINVLLAGSELTPLAKAGGLGDVLGSLPKALHPLVDKIWVALPYYEEIYKHKLKPLKKIGTVNIQLKKKNIRVTIWKTYIPNSKVELYLFENKKYFGKGRVYQGNKVIDPRTNRLANVGNGQRIRFLLFSQAVFEFIKKYNLPVTIIHGQDYHTAVLQALIKNDSTTSHIKTLLTIHNLGIDGGIDKTIFKLFKWKAEKYFGKKEFNRSHSPRLIKLAIDWSDAIVAVSPQYAKEILTKEYGNNLEKVLLKRKTELYGIINGIDTTLFNPQKDKYIKHTYSIKNLGAKLKNKTDLQKLAGLPINKSIPVIGLVSRLTSQKGLDLIIDLLPKLNKFKAQFVFEGTGPDEFINAFKAAQKKHPQQFYFHNIFDVAFAQKIYAGSDMFLMPSKFEPCGLGQIIAMRYGSVPIVRATGGLKNTIHHNKNGFVFTSYKSEKLKQVINQAIDTYYNKPTAWNKIIKTGMQSNYSWDVSAKKYASLYNSLVS